MFFICILERGGIEFETLGEPITLTVVRRVPFDISGESRGSYRLLCPPERVGRAPTTPVVASFDLLLSSLGLILV